ncbi:ABC transporter substrate-binding protein [Streptosporangium jomthongense]|uniref:ABC transporter substrate-binding protein n=1 Tax=Streptosporangium jomthongense TaxID=1193683 RepID=A0ABV8EZY3_9ACTN
MSFLSRLKPALLTAPLLLAAACGSTGTTSAAPRSDAKPAEQASAPAGTGGSKINISPQQNRIRAEKVDAIAAQVPEAIRAKGELVVGFSGEGAPPLTFLADDDRTVIGVETDIAHIVADVLGLKAREEVTSWENLFLSVKSGKYDVAFNNVTVTEERKDIYDFATYRVDQLAWQTAKNSPITSIKQPSDIAGRRVAVGSGTNQEKILVDWDTQNQKAGLKPAQIQNYQKYVDALLSLKSGRIEAYFGPNPSLSHQDAVGGDTKIVGTVSGAGPDLQGLIAAMTKKDNGLVKPLNAAINELIGNGKYGEVLKRWNLSNEAIPESLVNPPGLPRQTAK